MRSRRLCAGVAGAAAAGAVAWEVARRRLATALEADPHRDVLTAPLPGRAVTVAGPDGALRARVAGPDDAPTIVCAHGWGMGTRFWVHQLRDLSDRWRVVAYDQRGHGASEVPDAHGYTPEALAADLEAVLDQLVEGPFLLVGHSMGAMAILAWARQRLPSRQRLRAAVLTNTGIADLRLEVLSAVLGRVLGDALGQRMIRARVPLPRRSTPISPAAIRWVAHGVDPSPAHVALTEHLFLDCPTPVRAGFGAMLHGLDLTDAPAALEVPTVVVTGSHDRLTPPRHGRRLAAALPEGTLVEVAGAGHQHPLDDHATYTGLVRDLAEAHLRGAGRPGGAAAADRAQTAAVAATSASRARA